MYERITKKLFSAESIALFMHINPDGDCVGSCLAAYKYFKNLGKRVHVFAENSADIRANLHILPNISVINAAEDKSYDLGIALDCGSASRMGGHSAKIFFDKCEDKACFDHHATAEPFVDDLIFENVAATAQILYKFFKENDPKAIDTEVAFCLYAGIVTDSGALSFSNTTAETCSIAAELLGYGIDGSQIIYKLMKEVTPNAFRLRNRVLSGTQFFLDGRVGIISFLNDDFKLTGTSHPDTEGIINEVINVEGVQIAVSIAEMEEVKAFKVGIRTKGKVDAGAYAKLFGGGGHLNASGCRIYDGYTGTLEKLIKAAKLILDGDA